MRIADLVLVSAAAAGGLVSPSVFAQVSSSLTHTFPFGGCYTTGADGGTIFMGAGAGIYVLDGSADEPTFVTTPTGVKSQLHAGGLVRDIAVADEYLYVAADRKGLVRFDRPTMNVNPEAFTALTGGFECWAVTTQHVGAFDVVLVGSNTGYSDG